MEFTMKKDKKDKTTTKKKSCMNSTAVTSFEIFNFFERLFTRDYKDFFVCHDLSSGGKLKYQQQHRYKTGVIHRLVVPLVFDLM